VSWWDLESDYLDSTDNDNNGTASGDPTQNADVYGGDTPVKPRAIDNAPTVQSDAIGAGSASFDGSDDYILTGYDDSGSPIDVTYTFWAKSAVTGTNQGVFGHGGEAIGALHFNFGGGALPLLYLGTNLFRFWVDNGAQDDGKWHHWAVVVDGDDITNCEVFVDGTSLAVSSTTSSGSTYNAYTEGFQIGTDGGSNYFEGNICQFGAWEALLTQAQIQSIMEKTYEELTASERTNLVSYWALDETTLGSELVTDGDMSNAGSWTAESTAVIANNVCTVTGATNNQIFIRQSVTLADGKLYRLIFTVSEYGAGAGEIYARVSEAGSNVQTLTMRNANGTYTEDFTASENHTRLDFLNGNDGNYIIDDVSLKEVLVEDLQGSNNGSLM